MATVNNKIVSMKRRLHLILSEEAPPTLILTYFLHGKRFFFLHWTEKNVSNAVYLPSFADFSIEAVFTLSRKLKTNIAHDGYTYSCKYGIKSHLWYCTSASNTSSRYCGANIETKIIDGKTLIRLRDQRHVCIRSRGRNMKKSLSWKWSIAIWKTNLIGKWAMITQ